MYQFTVSITVVELREKLAKYARRGFITESKMIKLVKKFAEEKEKAIEGQEYITIWDEDLREVKC